MSRIRGCPVQVLSKIDISLQGYKVVAIPGTFSETGEWTPALDLVASKRGAVDIFFNHNETECRGGRPLLIVLSLSS